MSSDTKPSGFDGSASIFISIVLGIAIGGLLGLLLDQVPIGMGLGGAFGLVLGVVFSSRNDGDGDAT